MSLEPVVSKLERFVLYKTQPHMYLVGSDKLQTQYRVIKMDRGVADPKALSDFCFEDPNIYGPNELLDMLEMINEGNKQTGGLVKVVIACGIVGFIRFLDCFYLHLITKRKRVGSIGGNLIYVIKATEIFSLKTDPGPEREKILKKMPSESTSTFYDLWSKVNKKLNPTPKEVAEARYLSLFHVIDFTKYFFFSYTYDLTNSLQHNMTASSKTFPPPPFKDIFAWNYYMTREFESLTDHNLHSSFWVQPIIHGAFLQRKCSIFGTLLTVTVLARRSRRFAGTRYLKRGVSDTGAVANDVETEQIAHIAGINEGIFSSFVQMRGSIPTYWAQESGIKPPILLSRVDSDYKATQSHFADLLSRYKSPLLVLDLVKLSEKKKREAIVGTDYRNAINWINFSMPNEHKIQYCSLDFSYLSKHNTLKVFQALEEVADWTVSQLGFFCSGGRKMTKAANFDGRDGKKSIRKYREQQGVLRTNCIDCLDRTNFAQYSIGAYVLGKQLFEIGASSTESLEQNSKVLTLLMDLYSKVGDDIAKQYGGSEAHKKAGSKNKHKELLTSIRRFYSNAFTDRIKQDAINLFLGYYIPSEQDIPLWELENDYYLHNSHVFNSPLQSMREYKKDLYYPDFSSPDLCALLEKIEKDFTAMCENEDKNINKIVKKKNQISLIKNRSNLKSDAKNKSSALISSHKRNELTALDIIRMTEELKKKRKKAKVLSEIHAMVDSQWWKEALRQYEQAKMWMKLGPPKNTILPRRFDRIYDTHKLTSFDRCFSREHALTISVVHDASSDDLMHKSSFTKSNSESLNVIKAKEEEEEDDEEPISPKKQIDEEVDIELDDSATTMGERGITIGHYVGELTERAKRMLQNQIGMSGNKIDDNIAQKPIKDESDHFVAQSSSHMSLGSLNLPEYQYSLMSSGADNFDKDKAPDQYIKYVKLAKRPDILLHEQHDKETEDIYEEYMSDFNVDLAESSCVKLLEKKSMESNCSRLLVNGPHRGLDQDVSAKTASRAIVDQLELQSLAMERNEDMSQQSQQQSLTDRKFYVNGLLSIGMQAQIDEGLAKLDQSVMEYSQSLNGQVLSHPVSSLVSLSTVELYYSYFQPKGLHDEKDGFNSVQSTEEKRTENYSYINTEIDFVRVDDDLYLRRSNPYILFNGAASETLKKTPAKL